MYQLANVLLCTCTAVFARASEVPTKCVYEDVCERVVVSTPPAAARGAYTNAKKLKQIIASFGFLIKADWGTDYGKL